MMISRDKTRNVFDRYEILSEDDLKEAARMTREHTQSQGTTNYVIDLKSGKQGPFSLTI